MTYEATLWHPVARSTDLTDRPVAVGLLDQPLVLWRDSQHIAHAWADRCPHRGARLSLGRIQHDALQCAYHGWCFGADGRAITIPALPGFVPPATHCAIRHHVAERYGLLWVRLLGAPGEPVELAAGDGHDAGIPWFAAEADTRLRKVTCGPYDVATSAPRIVENFLDMAHFGFVHENWLGSREHAAIDAYQVEETPNGLLATGCRAWQPRSSLHAEAPAQVEYTYEVNAPYTAVLTKIPQADSTPLEGFREAIALFICPISPQTSRVWFRLAMNDFASPDHALQAFQHTIFTQDQPVLESQWPRCLPISAMAPVTEVHCAADRSATAYRRYLQRRGVVFGTC